MKKPTTAPHAIVEITPPAGNGPVIYDSWDQPKLFKSVDVELVTNETSQAEWSIFDPKFRVIDAFAGASPVPQSTVRVYVGYGPDLGQPVFKGLLAEVGRERESTRFTAFDMGFKMKLEKKAGYKAKTDDLGIIKALAVRNGLKFVGPDKPLKLEPHKSMMQDEQTDWDHAMERARDAGLILFVRGDTLFADYPAKVTNPILTLRNRQDFNLGPGFDFTFRTPENLDGRPKVIKHRGRGKGGKRIEGQSDVATRGHESIVLKRDAPGTLTKSKLSKRAQAQKELDREHAFEGRIETIMPTDGTRLDVRKTVAIWEVGKLFSGKYICDRVTLRHAPGKLGVELDLYRDIAE